MMSIPEDLMGKAREASRKMRDLGRKGGRATVKRHGKHYMAEIGRKGFMVTCARHWQGDKRGFVEWLHDRAYVATFEALASAELGRQIEAGAAVACVELPY